MIKKEKIQGYGKIFIIIQIISGLLIYLPSIPFICPTISASTWLQTSENDFYNGTSENLSIIGTAENAQLSINLTGLHTFTKKNPKTSPIDREELSMAPIFGTDKILLFGGFTPGLLLNDTWIYDQSDDNWIQKSPAVAPNARCRHAMTSLYGTEKVMLFGGFYADTHGYAIYNDTWIYDLNSEKWINKTSGTEPGPREGHAMASVWGTDKVVLFGGYNMSTGRNGETWIYDSYNNTWTQGKSGPDARDNHAMASVWGTDNVVLFGGFSDHLDNETWIYDLSEDSWTELSLSNHPSARSYHDMATIQGTDKIVLFGGFGYNYKGDTWVYDLNENQWEQILMTTKPTARRNHAMAGIYGTNKVLLFGGYSEAYLNDTWIYSHFTSTKNGSFISAPFDTCSNSSFHTISWNANIPINTSLKFQLRSGANLSSLNNKTFIGPNGNSNTCYTLSPTDIWSGHNGDRWIQYRAFFNMSVLTASPILENVTITYNCLPMTIGISPLNNSLIATNKPIFLWTFKDYDSKQQKGFQVQIDDDINFQNILYDSAEQITAEQRWEFPNGTSYSELSDGTWFWRVRTMDSDDVWSDFCTPFEFTIDTIMPSSKINEPINNKYYNKLPMICGVASDGQASLGINKVEILVKRLTDSYYWNGTDWGLELNWLLASGKTAWVYDSSLVEWCSGTKYGIQSRATDNATNVEIPSAATEFTIDMDSPSSIIEIPMYNIWLNNLDRIGGNTQDLGGSGIKEVEISLKCTNNTKYWDGIKWINEEYWLPVIGTNNWSINTENIPLFNGHRYIIQARAEDNIGNMETPALGTFFNFDNSPPNKLLININNNTNYTALRNVNLSLQAWDSESGVSQMSFSTDNIEWLPWEPFNKNYLFKVIGDDGEKKIYFKVRDYAGNIAESVFDTIILDTTPPTEVSILINEGNKYTTSINVNLTLKGSDLLAGISDMSFSYDQNTWFPWEPFVSKKIILLPSGDGEKILFFKLKDNAGNIAEPVYDSIILDTAPPYLLKLQINNGDAETNYPTVVLNLDAHDNTSGISQISFSNDSIFWSDWENFTKQRLFNLPVENGLKIIYFKVKDRAGNMADPISATILLNLTSSAENDNTPEKSLFSMNNWYILTIIVFLISFLIFIILIIFKKKSDRTHLESIAAGTFTIKPGALSAQEISVDLPGASISNVPKLPGSTTTTLGVTPQQTPVVQDRPQLPPAQPQTEAIKPSDTTPESAQPKPSLIETQQSTQKIEDASKPQIEHEQQQNQ